MLKTTIFPSCQRQEYLPSKFQALVFTAYGSGVLDFVKLVPLGFESLVGKPVAVRFFGFVSVVY